MTPAELRQRRTELGLTQARLAALIGVASNTVARWERGEATIGSAAQVEFTLRRLESKGQAVVNNHPQRTEQNGHRESSGRRIAGSDPLRLPAELSSFVGREQQLVELSELIRSVRLLTLTGPAGVGKTRLAQRLAATVTDDYPDGVWLVDLAPLADAASVPQAIAAVLGVREQPGVPLLASLLVMAASQRLLLVLDNCEHLVAACAEVAELILVACPGVRILATSREALLTAGEAVWHVAPLRTPAADVPLAEFGRFEAVQLFVERARGTMLGFSLTERSAPAVREICDRLDGLPLAIELAAARVRLLTPEQIAARLDDRFHLLVEGRRTASPRHKTLEAAVQWSYELLSQPEHVLFERLCVFVGGWTLAAAEVVCAGEGVGRTQVLDLLGQLVEKSLVGVDELGGEVRYRLLESVRAYGWQRLVERGRLEVLRTRHAEFFRTLATRADAELLRRYSTASFKQLESQTENTRAALRWLIDQGKAEAAQQLAGAMARFWSANGRLSEGRAWLAEALALTAGASGRAALARALLGDGRLATYQGDYPAARAALDASVASARAAGDHEVLADALYWSAQLANWEGDDRPARAWLHEALELSRATGQALLEGYCLYALGAALQQRGDAAAAHKLLEEGAALLVKVGPEAGMARLQQGWLSLARGQLDIASDVLAEALQQLRVQNFPWGVALALLANGWVAVERGQTSRARALYVEGLTLARQVGARAQLLLAVEGFAQLAVAQRRPDDALRLAAAAARERAATGIPLAQAEKQLLDTWLDRARRELRPAAAEAAWHEGQQWSLAETIEQALAGNLADVAAGPAGASSPARPIDRLTEREREVALLTARGLSNSEMAEQLVISERTVEAHLDHIRTKLDLRSRTHLVAWVLAQTTAAAMV